MKLYEAEINDKTQGVNLISLVKDPANKTHMQSICNGLATCPLGSGNEFVVPVLIPGQKIPRQDEESDEIYNISFSAEEIKKSFIGFMERQKLQKTDVDHDGKIQNKKVIFLENWIKEFDEDKGNKLFDLPVGTWFTKLKVTDPKLIKDIEAKKIQGVSIYGEFDYKLKSNDMNFKKEAVEKLKSILKLAEEEGATPDKALEDRIKALEDGISKIMDMLEGKEPTAEEMEATKLAEEEAEKEKEKTEMEEAELSKTEMAEKEALKAELSEVKTEMKALKTALEALPAGNQLEPAEPDAAPKAVLTLSEIIANNKNK